jgi:hypothetical protein
MECCFHCGLDSARDLLESRFTVVYAVRGHPDVAFRRRMKGGAIPHILGSCMFPRVICTD